MGRNKNTDTTAAIPSLDSVQLDAVKVGDQILIEGLTGTVQSKGKGFALVTTAVDAATDKPVGLYGNVGARTLKPDHKPVFGGLYAFIGAVPESHAGVPQVGMIDASTRRAIPADRLDAARALFAGEATEAPAEESNEG